MRLTNGQTLKLLDEMHARLGGDEEQISPIVQEGALVAYTADFGFGTEIGVALLVYDPEAHRNHAVPIYRYSWNGEADDVEGLEQEGHEALKDMVLEIQTLSQDEFLTRYRSKILAYCSNA